MLMACHRVEPLRLTGAGDDQGVLLRSREFVGTGGGGLGATGLQAAMSMTMQNKDSRVFVLRNSGFFIWSTVE